MNRNIKNLINMKKTFLTIMSVAAILAGCNKEKVNSNGTGTLAFEGVSEDYTFNDKDITAKSEASGVNLDEFDVLITSADGGEYSRSFKYSEIKGSSLEMPTGSFIMTVSSPEIETQKWLQPVYSGSEQFSIVGGSVTPVTVDCSVANVKVSVTCTEDFLGELTNYNITVLSDDDHNFVWSDGKANLSESAFFGVSDLTVNISGYRVLDGSAASISAKINGVAAADHIRLNVDARVTGSLDENGISIVIDPSLNDREESIDVPGLEPLPDDPEEPSDEEPVMTWEGNEDFGTMEIADEMNAVIHISAPAGIKNLIVTVESDVLEPVICQMISSEKPVMDLIYDENVVGSLGELLPVGDAVKDQKELDFDISQLVPLIAGLNPAPDSNHSFILSLEDNNGNTLEKTCTFHYTGSAE